MYGLADRITRGDHETDAPAPEGQLIPLFGRAGVMVIERDGSTTLDLIHACLGSTCSIAHAPDATTALARLDAVQPAVVLIDLGVDPSEVEILDAGLAGAGLDAIPVITIDPTEPINARALLGRVQAAVHVTRRVWFGGGLRSRMAA
jgi:hypothetical protein